MTRAHYKRPAFFWAGWLTAAPVFWLAWRAFSASDIDPLFGWVCVLAGLIVAGWGHLLAGPR